MVSPLQVVGEHVAEKGRAVVPDDRGGSHNAQVGVQGAGLFIVVAGPHLGDIVGALLVPEGNQAELAVTLKVLHAVDDLAPGFLQHFGPGDVVGLVKPSPKLHEGYHLFPVLRRPAENPGNLGGGGQAVNGDLDGGHVGPVRRLF